MPARRADVVRRLPALDHVPKKGDRLLPTFPPSPILRGSMRTVVLDSLQYILNGDGAEELFHLGHDSWQVRNLATAPEYQADLARYQALADELMAAYRREGEAMTKRENTIKMAEANKAFSHFAW